MSTKVYFITGSSRGLGRAIVTAALASGAHVIATARNPSTLDDLVAQHGAARVLTAPVDVTIPVQIDAAFAAGIARFGRVDVVVNNAGYGHVGAFEELPPADFRAQVETVLFGVVNVTRAVVPVLRRQGPGGHIIQVSSIGGRVATPGLTAYQAAKWGVAGFSLGLAQELAPLGIKVTVVEPGAMQTGWAGPESMVVHPISEAYRPSVGAFAEMVKRVYGHEPSVPEKVAEVVLKVVGMEKPPLRLLLGPDTVQYVRAVEDKQRAEDDRWMELSLSTTREGESEAFSTRDVEKK